MREAWYLRGGGESLGGGKENRSGPKSSSAVLVKYITEGTEMWPSKTRTVANK